MSNSTILIIECNLTKGIVEKKTGKVFFTHTQVQFNLSGMASTNVTYNARKSNGDSLASGSFALSENGESTYSMNVTNELRNSKVMVTFSIDGAVAGEYTLNIDPVRLDIVSVKFKESAYSGINRRETKAGTGVCFLIALNRKVVSGEDAKLQYKFYRKEPGENLYKERDGKSRKIDAGTDSVEVEIVPDDNHSGTCIAISFFLRGAVKLREGDNQTTVRYCDIISDGGAKVTHAYWSKDECIAYEKSPAPAIRTEICNDEDAFLHIRTQQMYGQEVTVKLYERDMTGLLSSKRLLIGSYEKVLIKDNVACVCFSMREACRAIKAVRSWEGGDYELFCEVCCGESTLETMSDLLLNYNESAGDVAAKSTIEGTKKFVIKAVDGENEVEEETDATCGIEYRNDINCTQYLGVYGPIYWGCLTLESYNKWDILLNKNKITDVEKDIIIGMSENEGKLDSVQSYDSEIVTVGAMQKTINPEGYGEFPIQMSEFKEEYPDKFKQLFENCGWTVKKENEKWRAYYNGETGAILKSKIRKGFSKSNLKKNVQCIPIEPLINATKDTYFQAKQIYDFIRRLHFALGETVVKSYHLNTKKIRIADENYSFKAGDILKSKLGKATLLDHSVNRPSLPKFDLGNSINKFFANNPNVSKKPSDWGEKHEEYEKTILEDYGVNRSGTDMKNRYSKMKNNNNLK